MRVRILVNPRGRRSQTWGLRYTISGITKDDKEYVKPTLFGSTGRVKIPEQRKTKSGAEPGRWCEQSASKWLNDMCSCRILKSCFNHYFWSIRLVIDKFSHHHQH